VRVLPDQRPALQFSGNQHFSNFRSSVHFLVFLGRVLHPFRQYSRLGADGSEPFFRQRWQFRESGKLIQSAGTARTVLSEMSSKVREVTLSGAGKRSRQGLNLPISGILSVIAIYQQLSERIDFIESKAASPAFHSQ
jgi:hypothetical protein